jgi:hypothetical protein
MMVQLEAMPGQFANQPRRSYRPGIPGWMKGVCQLPWSSRNRRLAGYGWETPVSARSYQSLVLTTSVMAGAPCGLWDGSTPAIGNPARAGPAPTTAETRAPMISATLFCLRSTGLVPRCFVISDVAECRNAPGGPRPNRMGQTAGRTKQHPCHCRRRLPSPFCFQGFPRQRRSSAKNRRSSPSDELSGVTTGC